MAEDGRLARIAGRSASVSATEPSLSDLLDPIALEERLREARARRAEALARRPDGAAPHDFRRPRRCSQPAAEAPATPRRDGRRRGADPDLPRRARPRRRRGRGPRPAGAPRPGGLHHRLHPRRRRRARRHARSRAAPSRPSSPPPRPPPPRRRGRDAAARHRRAAAVRRPAETLALRDPGGLAAPASEAAPPPASALPRAGRRPPAAATRRDAPRRAAALPARVYIHFPPSAAETAAAARDALRAAGVAEVEIVPVRYAIGRSNIRYYHDGDREPAAALARAPRAGARRRGAPEARDFTDYATPAAPGNGRDLAGRRPRAGSAARAAAPPAHARPPAPAHRPPTPRFQMPGVIAPPPTQAEQVERILIERLRQRPLTRTPPPAPA